MNIMRKMKFAALACSLILAFHSSQAFAAAVDTSDPKTITSVQLVLNSMGYDCGGSSGALDEATGDAIRRYQNDHGLNADGVISDALLESLNANESSLKLPGVSLENFTNRYNTAAVNSTGNAASSMNLLTDISFSSLGYDLDNLSDVKLWINEGFGNSQNIVGKIRIKTNNSGSIADAVKEEIKACIYAIDDSLTSTSEAEEIYNKIMQGSESLSENGILYELGKNEDVISVSAEHEGFIDTYSAFQYLGGPELLSYTPQGSSAAAANNGSNTAAQAAAPATATVTAPVSAEASAVSSTENYNGSVPANGTTAGSVPVDSSAAGTVPANGTTAGSVPVDGSTAGTVPANGTTAGTVPAGGYVSGDTSQTGSANTSASGENNAIGTAKTYLNTSAFSYSGLIEQLEFQGYTHDEAVYAADNCGADWNAQAAKKAKEELKNSAFNYSGLIGQLEFEGFTNAEATYGADNCGVNWNAQAVEKAKAYMNNANYSKTELIDQLVFEGFSQSQAEAAVNQVY